MITSIVFDFDGTLVDSNGIKKQTYYEVANHLGNVREIVEQVLNSGMIGDRYIILKEIVYQAAKAGQLSSETSIETWVQVLIDSYTRVCEVAVASCPEIPGATATLQRLHHQGYSLFVNSATPLEPLQRLLELRNFTHYCTGVYGRPASKVENLQTILKNHKTHPTSLVVVGDGVDDQQSAQEIGCHFVAVLGSWVKFPTMPLYKVQDLSELSVILEQIGNT